MAIDIGGKIGIGEDDLDKMDRTIQVLAEIGFLELSDEGVVSLGDESTSRGEREGPESRKEDTPDESSEPVKGEVEAPADEFSGHRDISQKRTEIDLTISIDATEMSPEDLKEKLDIISNTLQHDS